MVKVLSDLFRLPINGQPITVMQLAGFPAEVVDSVVSVLCRMAFEFGVWSDGAAPLLVACEEAHRYAPADRKLGFGPTRKALSRIAKEGRKYGVFLGAVTQRPAELDPTILSQCSTVFAMRMANDRDQAIVRSAVPDAASSLLDFLPSLGTREAIAFGEGVALPTRFRFAELAEQCIPAQLLGARRPDRSLRRHQRPVHRPRRRPLARCHHQQPAEAQRAARRRPLGLDRDGAARPRRLPRHPVEPLGRRYRRPARRRARGAQAHVGMDQAQARPSPPPPRPVGKVPRNSFSRANAAG